MYSTHPVIARIEAACRRFKSNGARRWVACCPAHEDRTPSLAVREADDGRILLHCFGGCEIDDVVAALGLEMKDLFPPGTERPERTTFPAADVLACLTFEAKIVALTAIEIANGQELTADMKARLLTATQRLDAGIEYATR
jgi:CHC2 zinc finger